MQEKRTKLRGVCTEWNSFFALRFTRNRIARGFHYKDFGINRLSIGLQSTKNELLKETIAKKTQERDIARHMKKWGRQCLIVKQF